MTHKRLSAGETLSGLKDFQRRTVDYAFGRLYGEGSSGRFLVADEVGLGKTLVARGIIARALEYLHGKVKRIDIVYVCSNAAIASQNVNRLNVHGQPQFALATRLTMLPMQAHELEKNRVNFVSFTPGTTFDMKSRGGRWEERALIVRMLHGESGLRWRGLVNLLQMNMSKENWNDRVENWSRGIPIDKGMSRKFRVSLRKDKAFFNRLAMACDMFGRFRRNIPGPEAAERDAIVGELRHRLATGCLEVLEPDLIILDEFQRFKDIMDGDHDAAKLARSLFEQKDVKTLLLSATPYRMLSFDQEEGDDHYPDFLRTLRFLFNSDMDIDRIANEIQEYRVQLMALKSSNRESVIAARNRVQNSLMQVMCRTERVAMTKRLDAMLFESSTPALIEPQDLNHALLTDAVASAVGAREPMEYWKSSPYLLSYLKGYDLRSRLDRLSAKPSEELIALIRESRKTSLRQKIFDKYESVEPGSPRMRMLTDETIGQGMWKLLWLPPSMPYTKPSGPYAGIPSVTKRLVFSSWNMVPDAIATLVSYEAERRMTEEYQGDIKRSELYDRHKPLLRFAKGRDSRLTGMPILLWLLPSPALAEAVDPLDASLNLSDDLLTTERLIQFAQTRVQKLLNRLPAGESGKRADERWYWAAVAMLEKGTPWVEWCNSAHYSADEVSVNEADSRFVDHMKLMASAANDSLNLGPRPKDLARVLAEVAVAGPGVCALRSLRRVTSKLQSSSSALLSAALKIAQGIRTLFNLPETIVMLKGSAEESYWRLALQYALDGNLQSLLDEQTHVLLEQLGLVEHGDEKRAIDIAEGIASALSIRTAQVQIDELKAERGAIRKKPFNARCRFALRFGELKDDKDSAIARVETVRDAFNSPFRPFVLASTSVGQEGLDFHTWCHCVVHWNLPSNPVDLEQREGRVHRYKGHAVRKNIAERYGIAALRDWNRKGDPWQYLFDRAKAERSPSSSDIVPYWVFEDGAARIERRVPLLPYSREVGHLKRLKRNLALYRLVFGQPRQEDLLCHLSEQFTDADAEAMANTYRISLEPPDK